MERGPNYESSIAMRDTLTTSKNKDNNRRRSLKTLFHLPRPLSLSFSTRGSTYGSMQTTAATGSIPADIVREIVDLLPPADILSFSLTSTHLRTLLLPALYDTVTLKSSRNCSVVLNMLSTRPDICACIRKLAVRPNYYLAWPRPDEPLNETWVVGMIQAISPTLTGMHTFDWDGLEVPEDGLWRSLRLNCPELKSVFSNVGLRPLDPNSALFDFSNLTSFSLIVRHGLGGSELFPSAESLPPSLWRMLLVRCPDLQELAICSFSSSARVFDFDPITTGRWPKLHTLTLGSFGYQSDFSLGPPILTGSTTLSNSTLVSGLGTGGEFEGEAPSLTSFLELHPSLKYIRFLWNFKRWMSPDLIPFPLSSSALPNLDTFIGVYQQLAELPHPKSVDTLDLTCEPIYESRLDDVCPILKSLTNLTSLDIWTHVFDSNREHGTFFEAILSSCPKLTDFHFMCTTSFTVKPLKSLISRLRLLPSLKRFSLTKGHKYIDESMLSTALRILKYNPALKQINVRWARERCPNHLKQEGSYDVLTEPDKDANGRPRPVALMVVERGIPLVGVPFVRRYRHRLDLKDKDQGGESRLRPAPSAWRNSRFSV